MLNMNEQQIIWNLIASKINSFSLQIHGLVDVFYQNYDPIKSLDKSFLLDLIETVNCVLNTTIKELKNGKKNNC